MYFKDIFSDILSDINEKKTDFLRESIIPSSSRALSSALLKTFAPYLIGMFAGILTVPLAGIDSMIFSGFIFSFVLGFIYNLLKFKIDILYSAIRSLLQTIVVGIWFILCYFIVKEKKKS